MTTGSPRREADRVVASPATLQIQKDGEHQPRVIGLLGLLHGFIASARTQATFPCRSSFNQALHIAGLVRHKAQSFFRVGIDERLLSGVDGVALQVMHQSGWRE